MLEKLVNPFFQFFSKVVDVHFASSSMMILHRGLLEAYQTPVFFFFFFFVSFKWLHVPGLVFHLPQCGSYCHRESILHNNTAPYL